MVLKNVKSAKEGINVFSVCMGSAKILFSYEPESFVITELMFLILPRLFITLTCVKENNTTSFITIFAVNFKVQYTQFNHLKTGIKSVTR